MDIETLKAKRANFVSLREQAVAAANANTGAIAVCDELIKEMEEEMAQAKPRGESEP